MIDDGVAQTSDAGLMIGVARKRPAALTEVFRRHGGITYSLASRILRDRELATETVKETFCQLWRHPDSFDFDQGSLRSYLLAETRCRASNVVRSDRTTTRVRDERDTGTVVIGRDVGGMDLDVATSRKARNALKELSEGEGAAIALLYSGRTCREAAVLLNETESTVKCRVRSGLCRLHTTLAAGGDSTGRFLTPTK